jgi:hypothetical protein
MAVERQRAARDDADELGREVVGNARRALADEEQQQVQVECRERGGAAAVEPDEDRLQHEVERARVGVGQQREDLAEHAEARHVPRGRGPAVVVHARGDLAERVVGDDKRAQRVAAVREAVAHDPQEHALQVRHLDVARGRKVGHKEQQKVLEEELDGRVGRVAAEALEHGEVHGVAPGVDLVVQQDEVAREAVDERAARDARLQKRERAVHDGHAAVQEHDDAPEQLVLARVELAEVAQHCVELGVHRLEHARRRDALAVLHAQHRVELRARVVRADEREHVLDLQDCAVVQGRAVGIVVLQRAQPLHAPRRAGEAVVDEALPQKVLDEVQDEGAALDLCLLCGHGQAFNVVSA